MVSQALTTLFYFSPLLSYHFHVEEASKIKSASHRFLLDPTKTLDQQETSLPSPRLRESPKSLLRSHKLSAYLFHDLIKLRCLNLKPSCQQGKRLPACKPYRTKASAKAYIHNPPVIRWCVLPAGGWCFGARGEVCRLLIVVVPTQTQKEPVLKKGTIATIKSNTRLSTSPTGITHTSSVRETFPRVIAPTTLYKLTVTFLLYQLWQRKPFIALRASLSG